MSVASPPTALPDFTQPQWQTPAMKQFVRFKTEHPDCLLLFRMGDFYELFGPDAETAHRALGITLTEHHTELLTRYLEKRVWRAFVTEDSKLFQPNLKD